MQLKSMGVGSWIDITHGRVHCVCIKIKQNIDLISDNLWSIHGTLSVQLDLAICEIGFASH